MPDPTIESKTLVLDNSPLAIAYTAIVDHVMANEVLAGVVKRWETSPYTFEPGVIQLLPMIITSCGVGPMNDRTAVTADEYLRVGFVIRVAKGNHVDLLNLEWALRRSIHSRNDTWLAEALEGSGGALAGIRWTQPAGTYEPDPGTKALNSIAMLEVQLSTTGC